MSLPYPFSHSFSKHYSVHYMPGALLGTKDTNILSLQQLCELLQHFIISFFYNQKLLRPCEVWRSHLVPYSREGIQPKQIQVFRCKIWCLSWYTMPGASPSCHRRAAPSPSHCASGPKKKRWDDGNFFYLCWLCPHTCLLSGCGVGDVLSRKGFSGRRHFFLMCPFRCHHYESMERNIFVGNSQNIPKGSPSCEDTARRWPSAIRRESCHQTPTLPVPWSQTSTFQSWEK